LLAICGFINVIQGLQSSMAAFTCLRLLLGLFEAGVYPGCSYVLTNWYSPDELYGRMTIFYSGASLASAFSGLRAYTIGHIDYTWGYRGWRFTYVLECIFTIAMGLLGLLLLSPNPNEVKTWLNGDERRFLVLRARFSHGGESGVHDETAFSWKYAKQAVKSIHVYAVGLVEFTVAVVVYGISYVLPTIIASLGYSTVKAQAMTAPSYVFACFVVVLSG
jgi:MFS family permease